MSVAEIVSSLGHFLASHKDEWNEYAEEHDIDASVDDVLMALIVTVLQTKEQ